MDLGANSRILNGDNLLEHDAVLEERAMLHLLLRAVVLRLSRDAVTLPFRLFRLAILRVVLERSHHVKDVLVPEQLVKQVGVV